MNKETKNKVFIGAAIVFCFAALIVAVILILKSGVFTVKIDSEPEDFLAPRIAMSDNAHELGEAKAPGETFINTMRQHINSARTDEVKKSLEIYLLFLSTRHGFYEETVEMFDDYMKEEETLSDKEKCELYQYRLLAGKYYIKNLFDTEKAEQKRASACDAALVLEENKQKDSESDYKYGERMYYSGFIKKGVEILEGVNIETLTDEELSRYSYNLYDYYMLIMDPAKFTDLTNKIRELQLKKAEVDANEE